MPPPLRLTGDLRPADGRPLRYVGTPEWLMAGMLRNPRGVIVALVIAWFNVPLGLLCAAGGTVAGGLAGALGGYRVEQYLPVLAHILSFGVFSVGGTVGPIIGGIVGAAAGAVIGLVLGILAPWLTLVGDSPGLVIVGLVGQVVIAAILGVAYTLFQVACEPFLLRLKGARPMSRRERELIVPIARQCARELGMPNLPWILINDSDEVNAMAGTRHIVLNHGLLDEFDYDPEVLAGVISHELTHWDNADPVAAAFVRGIALPLYLIYIGAMAVIRLLNRHPFIRFIIWYWGWAFMAPVRFVIIPAQAADARRSELRGDGGAARAGHLRGMRTCLTRLKHTVDGSRSGWEETICALHPPNELRLERLEQPGVAYPLPDPEAPPKPFPVTVVK